MPPTEDTVDAAQSREECLNFVEAFARVNIEILRAAMAFPEIAAAVAPVHPDWDDPVALAESGLQDMLVDDAVRSGNMYLHIDVAMSPEGNQATSLFLQLTGLSDKQQKFLFPQLSGRRRKSRALAAVEVRKINEWLEWVRSDGFDPLLFLQHQRSVALHGRTQNITGAIGAIGASVAFLDAVRELDSAAVRDVVGTEPPTAKDSQSPRDLYLWRESAAAKPVSTILLANGRAITFAASKDVNIYKSLEKPFGNAAEAEACFVAVRNDASARKQVLHEFAVGEVKTATDMSNLHERLGLASRETQTELRTDRFLMMSLLTKELLEGGIQGRVMNNRDLRRFSQVFNLHHCWGWDGGRERHPEHWHFFLSNVRVWCGL